MRLIGVLFVFTNLLLVGCSTGDLRAFNDAMNNNYYPDQRDVKYVGDVRWETGVRNGSGYQKIKNTGGNYCKAKVIFEDGTSRVYRLEPHKSLSSMYVSLYNQTKRMHTMCHKDRRVFREKFT